MTGWLVCVEGEDGQDRGFAYYAIWEPREAKARRRVRAALRLADTAKVELVRQMSDEILLATGAQPGRIARVRAPGEGS